LPGDLQAVAAARRAGFGQHLRWRLEAAAFRLLTALLRAMGLERASAFGGWLLRTLGPITGTHRTVIRNLRIAFPDMLREERERLALAQWEQTGRTFAETVMLDRVTVENGRVEIVNQARFDEIKASGRPVVFVSGHLACFEVMSAAILAQGIPCQITYRPTNNPYVDALIRESRARYGVKLFAPKGGDGARELLAGLQRGESVALMNDQKFNEGPEVTFFGQPVNAAPGPTRLALRFGTVLQPLSVTRLPGVRFRLTVHEPIAVRNTGDKAEDVRRGVQAITSFVEDRVRERPVDWFWVHKRWPDKVYAALPAAEEPSAA